jgi:hypothetical protein
MVTCEVLIALNMWKEELVGDEIINKAVAWILKHQHPDGGFGSDQSISDPYESSLAVLAIRSTGLVVDLENVADYLKNAQSPKGGWDDSVYTTAIATRALIAIGAQ